MDRSKGRLIAILLSVLASMSIYYSMEYGIGARSIGLLNASEQATKLL